MVVERSRSPTAAGNGLWPIQCPNDPAVAKLQRGAAVRCICLFQECKVLSALRSAFPTFLLMLGRRMCENGSSPACRNSTRALAKMKACTNPKPSLMNRVSQLRIDSVEVCSRNRRYDSALWQLLSVLVEKHWPNHPE
jgi:hypothetical protein